MPSKILDLEKHFWSKVDIRDENECWNWQAAKDHDGYGISWDGNSSIRAHRLAYQLTYGLFPQKLLVLHSCDNPLCCNPQHLFLGSQLTNMRDMDDKGRRKIGKRGFNLHNALLSETDIPTIRQMLAMGMSLSKIADTFNVSFQCISSIKTGKSWSHVK